MSDYNDSLTVQELCEKYSLLNAYITKLEKENQILVKRHIELEDSLIELRKYHKEFEQFASTVYAPNKSTYKELEDKLALAENSKQTAIDDLYETKIGPLQNKIKDQHTQIESQYKRETKLQQQIKELETLVKDQQTIINYAAGYISACEQFRDKHPTDVIKWLFKGLK